MTHTSARAVVPAIAKEVFAGLVLIASGMAVGYLTLAGARLPGALEWAVIGYVPVALVVGIRMLHNARARLHGRSMEDRATQEAVRVLPRWGIQVLARGMPVAGIGDIDLVAGRGQRRLPIEIKSFHAWDGAERCAHAVVQVHRQMASLHSGHGIVWLPEAGAGWWRRWFGLRVASDITVAFGSARNLARIARRRL